jgi:gamma-glutamyl phosphate reductase
MTREYTDLVRLSRFSKLLMEDRFKIRRESTNYAELQTLISILDVAIDNGATTEQTQAEKDSEVDGLVEQLRAIFSRIIDTNARDLTRSEAKDMLDRLIMRLTFQVRSKQKMALDLRQSTISWVA